VELRVRYELVKLLDAATERALNNDLEDASTLHTYEIESILSYFAKEFRLSFKFNSIWAAYLYLFKANKFVAMQKTRVILNNSPMMFDIIPLQIRLRFFAETTSTDDLDSGLETFEEQLRLERYAMDALGRAISLQARFWGTLVSEDYSLSSLQRLCTLTHAASNEARQAFLRNIALNPKSPLHRRLYSHFLMNVANDEEGAKRQLNRAVELEEEADNLKALTSSTNCIIIISGESDSMGKILEVNDRTCDVFETTWEDMTSKVINVFMARPFAAHHNSYLKHYIEEKPTGVTGASRKGVILKTSGGFVMEADLQVREYANFTLEPSITFFGVLQPHDMRKFCVVKRSDLIVYDVSKLFFQFFCLDSQKLRAYELRITDHLPLFEAWQLTIDESVNEGATCTIDATIIKGGQEARFLVHVSPLPYLAKEYYHVMVDTGEDSRLKSTLEHSIEQLRQEPHLKKKAMMLEDSDFSGTNSEDGSTNDFGDMRKDQKDNDSVTSSARSGQLLRMSLSRHSAHFDASLQYLLYSVVVLLTGLSVLGICMQVVWSELTLNRSHTTLNLLTSPIQVGTVTATYSALMFQHIVNGTLFDNEADRMTEEARIEEDLTVYRDEMDLFRDNVFSELSYLTAQEKDEIRNAMVSLVTHEMKAVNMTLMEAVHQYTGSMSLIVKRNLTELQQDPLPLHFVIANSHTSIPQVWDYVCNQILEKQVGDSEFVRTLELYIAVSAIVAVVVAALVLFFPVVYHNNKQCAEIFSMFERVEMGNKKEVYSQCIQWLEDLDESSTHMLDLQDVMEVLASKKANMEGVTKRRIRVSLFNVLIHRLSWGILFVLALTVLYFLGYYLWWQDLYRTVFDGTEYRVYHAVSRKYYMRKVLVEAIQYNIEEQRFDMDIEAMKMWEDHLWDIDHALYYGNTDLHIETDIRVMAGGDKMLNDHLCDVINATPTNVSTRSGSTATSMALTQDRCINFFRGVLAQPPHEAVMAFLSFSQDLRKTYTNNPLDPCIKERILILKEMADYWLLASQKVYIAWIRRTFRAGYEQAASFREWGTAAYIVVCILSYFFVYQPLIRRMHQDLINTRDLLLIIPIDILENSKAIKETVKRLATRLINSD
jgi:hypothetical protein